MHEINFSGLNFEIGQSFHGLVNSSKRAREYFYFLQNNGVKVFDRNDLDQEKIKSNVKVYSDKDLKNIQMETYEAAFEKTVALLSEIRPLINWGGDHSISIATVAAFVNSYDDGFVIWIDAHADLNIPNKSHTGHLHGMPLSFLLNLDLKSSFQFKWIKKYLNPKKLIYIGLRDLDPFESDIIAQFEITAFTYKDIQENGISFIISKIVERIKNYPVHISFDIDSVNPDLAPSTGVPVRGGLSQEDLHELGKTFSSHCSVRSVDIVEINPLIGSRLEVDQTYIVAFNFLKTIFSLNSQGESSDRIGKKYRDECFNEIEWNL